MFYIQLTGNSFVDKLTIHFFERTNINKISWEQLLPSLDYSEQDLLIENTVNSSTILEYPLRISYQKQFLKACIEYFERKESVIADSVYDAFGRLVALPADSEFCYVYYPIKRILNDSAKIPAVILKENVNLISEGTTGLRTWQASLVLAEWALQNPKNTNQKDILELGSGIGLTGLIVTLFTKPSKYTMTDFHPTVLSVLNENVKVNLSIDESLGEKDGISRFELCDVNLIVERLSWAETTPESCLKFGSVDRIFAADVVYDRDIFGYLVDTLHAFFSRGTKEAIFSCTERNPETLNCFWKTCAERGLEIEQLTIPKSIHITLETDCSVFLSRITPRTLNSLQPSKN